ncbi:MAG TPA: TetR/AcrR family transcriptional regulator [Dongiaceae bacterium]
MKIGRPRAFDLNTALQQALLVFWRQGYEGTSIADLTEAMGINPPSLYAAFGSKEGLFRRALESYLDQRQAFLQQAYDQPTARDVAMHLLRGTADIQTDPAHPRGCLLIQGALSCGDTAEAIRQELMHRRDQEEIALCQRFERALREGDLDRHQDPASLARYITTILQGMAVKAASGASRHELQEIVDLALMAFPPPPTEQQGGRRQKATGKTRPKRMTTATASQSRALQPAATASVKTRRR